MKRNFPIVVFLLHFTLAFSANAYTFTDDFDRGFYWASYPITMNKFVLKSEDGVVLSSIVDECESEWEGVVGMPIWNIPPNAITSGTYGGNSIRWADDFAAETGFDVDSTLAVTVRHRVGTYFTRTEIILNGEKGNLRTNQSKLRQVILHEMGHTLGLGHTTEYGVMQATLNVAISELSDDDIEGGIAVVEETLWRQDNNYVSPYAREEGGSCGTISMDTSSGGGPGSFMLSFGLGLIAIMMTRRRTQYSTNSIRY